MASNRHNSRTLRKYTVSRCEHKRRTVHSRSMYISLTNVFWPSTPLIHLINVGLGRPSIGRAAVAASLRTFSLLRHRCPHRQFVEVADHLADCNLTSNGKECIAFCHTHRRNRSHRDRVEYSCRTMCYSGQVHIDPVDSFQMCRPQCQLPK